MQEGRPLRTGIARRVVWTLTACTALSLLGDATLYAVLPSYHAVLGLEALQVGWLLSINRLARIPLNLPSGWIAGRWGPKSPYVAGLAVGAISTLGYGLVNSFAALLLLRALWGLAWSLLVVAAYTMILDVSSVRTRGRLTSVYSAFSFLGGGLGAMLGGALVDGLGFAAAMRILGGLSILACAVALTLPRPGGSVEPSAGAGPVRRWARPSLPALRAKLSGLDRRLWLVWALNFAHRFFFAGVLYSTLGLYIRRTLGETVQVAGLSVGIASFTATVLFLRNAVTVVSGPALGWLSDHLGDRLRILALGEVLGVAGFICLAMGRSLWLLAPAMVCVAAAYGIVPPMLMAWTGDLTPAGRRGGAVGGYQTAGDTGSGLGPLVAYALVETMGTGIVYGLSAAILALTVPAVLRERRRRDDALSTVDGLRQRVLDSGTQT